MTPLEAAWSAGLFEGEGCVALARGRGNGAYPAVILQMTDRDVVERFGALIGASRIYEVHPKSSNHKTLYRVQVTGSRVPGLFEAWRSFLGARRLARFEEILAEATPRVATPGVCRHGHGPLAGWDGKQRFCKDCRRAYDAERNRSSVV